MEGNRATRGSQSSGLHFLHLGGEDKASFSVKCFGSYKRKISIITTYYTSVFIKSRNCLIHQTFPFTAFYMHDWFILPLIIRYLKIYFMHRSWYFSWSITSCITKCFNVLKAKHKHSPFKVSRTSYMQRLCMCLSTLRHGDNIVEWNGFHYSFRYSKINGHKRILNNHWFFKDNCRSLW